MIRSFTLLLVGALAGALLVILVRPAEAPKSFVTRDIVDVPKMSLDEADGLRRERFADLSSIEQVLSLPTRFMQIEALYAVAGRGDSARIQNLVFDADRIADEDLRIDALGILFFRLAELDPESALALAATESFGHSRHIERQVWTAFGYADLEAAIVSARSQATKARRYMAAQHLYAAYGHFNNPAIERLQAELGIPPNRSRRAQYLYRLADQSPEAAIDYINGLPAGPDRMQLVTWLAHYYAEADPGLAAGFSEMLSHPADRYNYDAAVASNAAKQDPKSVIDRLVSSGRSGLDDMQVYSAFGELVSSDLEGAKQYYALLESRDDRHQLGSLIVAQMVRMDADAALAWAREHDETDFPLLARTAVMYIAREDPARALAIAKSAGNKGSRSMLIQSAIDGVAEDNPELAMQFVDQIEGSQQRAAALSNLARHLLQSDPERATEWMETLDDETASELFMNLGYQVISSDTDAAIRLLPRVPAMQQQTWKTRIAIQLAKSGRTEEAAAFVGRFEGQEGFAGLQAAMISGIAAAEPERAARLAGQLSDVKARDAAYVGIINHAAERDPVRYLGMLESIANEQQRAIATSAVVSRWAMHDPDAATRYAGNLPSGPQRDMAIMGLASRWRDFGPAEQSLVASMQDDENRSTATQTAIFAVMRRNPARARALLEDSSLTDMQRQQLEAIINGMGGY